ncbi:MAG TPA: hypothetical protein VK997_04435 [Deferrisomatales bacterium]|nr:hypothetical protein [Deferrisomatales bacterium]
MSHMDDTVARYDPLEAVMQIVDVTGEDERTVAQVLEGEIDFLGCLGLIDEEALDDAARQEIGSLRHENADLLDFTEGEYDTDVAVSFIQRNRGITKEVIARILAANYAFMDERGLLDDDWGAAWVARARDADAPES